MRRLKPSAWLLIAASLLIATPGVAKQTATLEPLELPKKIEQGGIIRVVFKAPHRCRESQAMFAGTFFPLFLQQKPASLDRQSNTSSLQGLIGVSMWQEPGPYQLRIVCFDLNGFFAHHKTDIKVTKKRWGVEYLRIPKRLAQPNSNNLARIRKERDSIVAAATTKSASQLWQGNFLRPVPGKTTSPFGKRRFQNGKPRSPHGGTDFRAAVGTPIMAPNNGRVVLAGDFFLPGTALFLDHGGGLVTGYMHLQKVLVEEGAMVKKGDVVALSGGTGRVNAPHLHWQAHWMGTKVHPLDLLRLYPVDANF